MLPAMSWVCKSMEYLTIIKNAKNKQEEYTIKIKPWCFKEYWISYVDSIQNIYTVIHSIHYYTRGIPEQKLHLIMFQKRSFIFTLMNRQSSNNRIKQNRKTTFFNFLMKNMNNYYMKLNYLLKKSEKKMFT